MLLTDIQGWTLEETATYVDAPIGTIKSSLHRARKRLGRTGATILSALGPELSPASGGPAMLKRRLQGAFGSATSAAMRDAHLECCGDCREFVEFVDGSESTELQPPLDDQLRSRLAQTCPDARRVGSPIVSSAPAAAAAGMALEQARSATHRPPGSAARQAADLDRSPRYAIAASYLLTLLIAGTVGNPAAWAESAKPQIEAVGSVWSGIHSRRPSRPGAWHRRAGTTEGIETTKDFYALLPIVDTRRCG